MSQKNCSPPDAHKQRPALRQTFNCQANLRNCRNGAFEKNPLIQSGQSLLVSESPVEQAFPIRQDLTSLCEGIGSFKYNHRHAHRRGHLQTYITIYAGKMQVISHNIATCRKYFWDCKSHFLASAPSFLKTMTYHSNNITDQQRSEATSPK